MCLIVGIVLIIAGFFVKYWQRKSMRSNSALRIGEIIACTRNGSRYRLTVSYSPDNSANTEEVVFDVKKLPAGSQIVLQLDDTGKPAVYDGKIKAALLSSAFLAAGIVFCLLS